MEYRSIVTVLGVLINAAISESSQVITTQIGQTITMDCPLPNLDSDLFSIYWKKNDTTLYARTSHGETADGKHFVIGGTMTSLVIPDVVESDTGSYYCRVVRQSNFGTENSEMIKLYVTAFSVSHCDDNSQHVVDGCNCYVNRATITSLSCSARGFPNPPMITWSWWEEDGESTKRSSFVELTRFSDNVTLVCKAQARNLDHVSANTSVCVYYSLTEMEFDGDNMQIGSTEKPSHVLAITLPLLLIAIIICIILISLWAYRRKKGIPFCDENRILRRTSTPKPDRALDELRYNTVQLRMKSVEDDLASVDLPTKDCNEDMIFEDAPELSFPLVGQVLLDDLRSASSEDVKKSLKGVIDRLLNKRARPYKEFQMPINASYGSMPIGASALGIQSSLKESMVADGSTDRDVYFVGLVLQKLDQILDETDRDECEILITKPDFQEVTDVAQIPDYQGSRVINRSVPLQSSSSMRSSMNRSRIACSLESSVIREELKPMTSSERTAARNAISQMILDALRKRQRPANQNLFNRSTDMLQHNEDGFHSADDLVDENSRLVALWASKVAKLNDDVSSSITEYLFPLKPRKPEENKTTEPLRESVEGPIHDTLGDPGNGVKKQTTEDHMKEPVAEPDESMEGQIGTKMKEQKKDAVGETMNEFIERPLEEVGEVPAKEPMDNSMNIVEESCHQQYLGHHGRADYQAPQSSDDSFEK